MVGFGSIDQSGALHPGDEFVRRLPGGVHLAADVGDRSARAVGQDQQRPVPLNRSGCAGAAATIERMLNQACRTRKVTPTQSSQCSDCYLHTSPIAAYIRFRREVVVIFSLVDKGKQLSGDSFEAVWLP